MTGPQIAALVFDLDGTLVQSEHLHQQSWTAPLQRLGRPVDDETYYREFSGKPGMQIIGDHLGLHGDEAEAIYEEVTANYWDLAEANVGPTDGLVDFLDRTAALPKALCTSAQRTSALRMLDLLGLTARFSAIVTANDVRQGKPDPEPFALAATLLGIAPDRCAAFEDSANGLRSARAAGMFCIGIGEGVRTFPELADLWIRDFRDTLLEDLVFND
jgi:HAD superfamily hydrolase (TIGR01509 family)